MAAIGEFDIAKAGKFKVHVGQSIKNEDFDNQDILQTGYTNFRYNSAPPIIDPDKAQQTELKPQNGKYKLDYEDETSHSIATYIGEQRPGRKLECVLIYNPTTNSFTLERMGSTFTFNQEYPDNVESPIPTYNEAHQWIADEPEVDKSEGEEAMADVENPYDVRHFLRHRKDIEESMDELDVDDVEEEESGNDSDVVMTGNKSGDTPVHDESATTPGRTPVPIPTINVQPLKPLPKKRAPKKATDPFMPKTKTKPKPKASPLPPGPTSAGPRRTGGYQTKSDRDMSMSPASALPSPVHVVPMSSGPPVSLGRFTQNRSNTPRAEESSSDEDESDEDAYSHPPPPRQNLPVPMSRSGSGTSLLSARNEPDVLDLPSIPARRTSNNEPESDEDADGEDDILADMDDIFDDDESGDEVGDDGDPMVIEGDEDRGTGVGLGINVGGGPITLGGLAGANRRREEEESSSEEE